MYNFKLVHLGSRVSFHIFLGWSIFSRILRNVQLVIEDLMFFSLLSSVRSDAMLLCSLFHIIIAWYLIESILYDLLSASSTNAKFLEPERVEWLCCSVVFKKKISRGWDSCFLKEFFTSKAWHVVWEF